MEKERGTARAGFKKRGEPQAGQKNWFEAEGQPAGLAFPLPRGLGAGAAQSPAVRCPRGGAAPTRGGSAERGRAGSGVRGLGAGGPEPGGERGRGPGAGGGRSGSGGEERGWGPHAGSQPALCATLLNGAGVCARGLARISRAFP